MRCLLAAALSLSAATAAAQGASDKHDSHAIIVLPDHVTRGPAPPALPPGAKLAVLEGNPNEAGPFTMRMMLPAGYHPQPGGHRRVRDSPHPPHARLGNPRLRTPRHHLSGYCASPPELLLSPAVGNMFRAWRTV
jgi:hypothetical protein